MPVASTSSRFKESAQREKIQMMRDCMTMVNGKTKLENFNNKKSTAGENHEKS